MATLRNRTWGTPVNFIGYQQIPLTTSVSAGYLGVYAAQPVSAVVTEGTRNNLLNMPLNQIASVVDSAVLGTTRYIQLSWNESGPMPIGYPAYGITDLVIGIVVEVKGSPFSFSASDVLAVVDTSWITDSETGQPVPLTWTAYALTISTTCPTGYHWDATQNACVIDTPTTCPTGYHWDETQNACVIDIPTCPTGYHWDATVNACVIDTQPPPDGGLPNLGLVVTGVGLLTLGIGAVWYFWVRKKRKGE